MLNRNAGLGQTVLALVPLATLLLAVLQRQERLRLAAVLGALLALAGIAVLSRAPVREGVPLVSLLALVGSALCFAQAAVLVRRFPAVHRRWSSASRSHSQSAPQRGSRWATW